MDRIISISPDIQSGEPVFTGTRVPVKNLFAYLKGGDSIDGFLEDFPSVKREQIIDLLHMAETTVALRSISAGNENPTTGSSGSRSQ